MAAHSSVLAWRIPWTEEPDGLESIGVARVRLTQSDSVKSCTHSDQRTDSHGMTGGVASGPQSQGFEEKLEVLLFS